jgi:hypothetical protein
MRRPHRLKLSTQRITDAHSHHLVESPNTRRLTLPPGRRRAITRTALRAAIDAAVDIVVTEVPRLIRRDRLPAPPTEDNTRRNLRRPHLPQALVLDAIATLGRRQPHPPTLTITPTRPLPRRPTPIAELMPTRGRRIAASPTRPPRCGLILSLGGMVTGGVIGPIWRGDTLTPLGL